MNAPLNPTAFSSTMNNYQMQHMLQTNILSALRTGDPMLDLMLGSIVSMLVISLFSNFSSFFRQITSNFRFYLMKGFYVMWNYHYSEELLIERSAEVRYVTEDNFLNAAFLPLQWYLLQHSNLKDEPFVSYDISVKHETTGKLENTNVQTKIPYNRSSEITYQKKKVFYTMKKEQITLHADRERKKDNFIIQLRATLPRESETDFFADLIQLAIREFNVFQDKQKWKQRIFTNKGNNWDQGVEVKVSRRMETVILRNSMEKEIMKDFDEFLHSEEWYLQRDVPYTRRYLFYGEPGCGKTSCVKALASRSRRHIHTLQLSEVKSDANLMSLMKAINYEDSIVLIEDIDCATDVVQEREKEEKETEEEDKKEEHSSLTLSGLLNAIDGVIENHGQILIMTTNHPEVLDDALTRPGRMDRRFEFATCDANQIQELYFNFFPSEKGKDITFEMDKIILRPAEIVSMFIRYKSSPEEALTFLQNVIEELENTTFEDPKQIREQVKKLMERKIEN